MKTTTGMTMAATSAKVRTGVARAEQSPTKQRGKGESITSGQSEGCPFSLESLYTKGTWSVHTLGQVRYLGMGGMRSRWRYSAVRSRVAINTSQWRYSLRGNTLTLVRVRGVRMGRSSDLPANGRAPIGGFI